MRFQILTAATFLAFSLACARGGSEQETTDENEGEAGWFRDHGQNCDGTGWIFTAETVGDVTTVEVEVWVGNDQFATQDLIDRGAGDWYLEAASGLVGTDCIYSPHLIFRGYEANGDTFEEST